MSKVGCVRLAELLVHAVAKSRGTTSCFNKFSMLFLRYAPRIYLRAVSPILRSASDCLMAVCFESTYILSTSDKVCFIYSSRLVRQETAKLHKHELADA